MRHRQLRAFVPQGSRSYPSPLERTTYPTNSRARNITQARRSSRQRRTSWIGICRARRPRVSPCSSGTAAEGQRRPEGRRHAARRPQAPHGHAATGTPGPAPSPVPAVARAHTPRRRATSSALVGHTAILARSAPSEAMRARTSSSTSSGGVASKSWKEATTSTPSVWACLQTRRRQPRWTSTSMAAGRRSGASSARPSRTERRRAP